MSHNKSTTYQRPTAAPRPASFRRTAVFACIALAGSAAVTHHFSTRTVEQFSGVLQADAIDLTAPAAGTVNLVQVKSGQIVYPDDTLFVIRSSAHTERIAVARAKVDSLKSELRIAEARYELELAQILSDMDSEVHGIQDDLALLEGRRFHLEYQDTAFKDLLGALSEPVASTESTDLMRLLQDAPDPAMRLRAMVERGRIENELDTQEARIELCESRLTKLHNGQQQLPEKLRAAMGLLEVETRLATAQDQLGEAQASDSTLLIAAAEYGMAGVVQVMVDDVVAEQQTLLQIFDRSRERIQVPLPSRLIPDIQVGHDVALTFPGNELRTGRIDAIPPQVTHPPTADREATIQVIIRPVGRVWPTLPIGSTVNVSLQAE